MLRLRTRCFGVLAGRFLSYIYFTTLHANLRLDLDPRLIQDVVESLTNGWSTHYRGFSEWYLNFHRQDENNETQIKKEIQEDIKRGRVVGPF